MNLIYKIVQQVRVRSNKLKKDIDYYIDEQSGLMILTAHYLLSKGSCCGKKCLNCPYIPKHFKKIKKRL